MRQAAKPRKENTTFIYVYNNPQSMLYYNTMKPTLQINFFLAIPFLLCVTGIWPVHCSAQETDTQNTYSDANGYFSFTPPPGWKKEELSVEYRSHVMFQNQEETAKIMVFAEMDNADLQMLYELKRDWVKQISIMYPNGTFTLKKTSLNGINTLAIDYEIPGVSRKKLYFLYFDGVLFDLVYSTKTTEDYDRFKDAADAAFTSLQLKQRPLKKFPSHA